MIESSAGPEVIATRGPVESATKSTVATRALPASSVARTDSVCGPSATARAPQPPKDGSVSSLHALSRLAATVPPSVAVNAGVKGDFTCRPWPGEVITTFGSPVSSLNVRVAVAWLPTSSVKITRAL
jgi:hypothetical protein